MTANSLASKSFAEVFRSEIQKVGDFAMIIAKEVEVRDKLGQLNYDPSRRRCEEGRASKGVDGSVKEKTVMAVDSLASKSFVEVFRSRIQKVGDFAKIKAKEGEVRDKLGQLNCCLVGWWQGGHSPMPDLKTLQRRVWISWEVHGSFNMVEMGRGLSFFEFESSKEAERVLRCGTRKFGGFSISLKKWSQEDGCSRLNNVEKEVWVRLIGLTVHLWTLKTLKRIGDGVGGFLVMDEELAFLSDLWWARIRVKCNGKVHPKVTKVSVGLFLYEIQLWSEIQPRVMFVFSERMLEEEECLKGEDASTTRTE